MTTSLLHPSQALFSTTDPEPPVVAPCDHYAGSEKLMLKSLALQRELGPLFDITFDCEDGAARGNEAAHRELIVRLINGPDNAFGLVGVRIHDSEHPDWRADIDAFVAGAGARLAHITIPKAASYDDAARIIDYIEQTKARCGMTRPLPLHVLIESQGAVRDIWRIAQLPGLRGLDFGIMDFVSSHRGAIPLEAVRSPGQFEHRLIVRAKVEITAAALAHGLVPAHNVTLDLASRETVFRDAVRARSEFGFLRMWSIHPLHTRAIIEAFRPDFGAVAAAGEVLLAAQQAAWAPIRHRDELYDRASYRILWDTLQRAVKTGVAIPEAAKTAFF